MLKWKGDGGGGGGGGGGREGGREGICDVTYEFLFCSHFGRIKML